MIATALLAYTVAAAQAPPVQVEGDSGCPTASQVAALLPELLPPTEAAYSGIAHIEADGLDLRIELRSLAGETLFSRRLRSNGTCEGFATIAAVVIASWSAERNPGVSLLQPGVPAPPEPTSTSPPAARNSPAVDANPLSAGLRPIREIDLSAAIGGGLGSAGVVGVARVEAGLRGRRFGVRSGLWAETERSQTIASGSIASRRYGLSLGPTLAMLKAPMVLEARAEIFAGLTTVDGHHFDVDGHASKMAAGLACALRLGRATGWLRPWIDVGGQYWLADQALTVTKPQQQIAKTSLPSIEGRLLLGVSVLLSR
jgi:hypothetical protein